MKIDCPWTDTLTSVAEDNADEESGDEDSPEPAVDNQSRGGGNGEPELEFNAYW